MQNYFGPFYFGKLKPYNSKYCSNLVLFFGLQLIFAPFNFAVCFAREVHEIKGTQTIRVLQYGFHVIAELLAFISATLSIYNILC